MRFCYIKHPISKLNFTLFFHSYDFIASMISEDYQKVLKNIKKSEERKKKKKSDERDDNDEDSESDVESDLKSKYVVLQKTLK